MATILVVEDSTSVQQFLKKELEAMGHKAVVADNGLAALEEVDKQPVDAVITDYHMPIMTGTEFIKKVRTLKRFKKIPIAVMSSDAGSAVKAEAKEAGATGFAQKPIDAARFRLMVEKMLA